MGTRSACYFSLFFVDMIAPKGSKLFKMYGKICFVQSIALHQCLMVPLGLSLTCDSRDGVFIKKTNHSLNLFVTNCEWLA